MVLKDRIEGNIPKKKKKKTHAPNVVHLDIPEKNM
jgi:hypothetical protein